MIETLFHWCIIELTLRVLINWEFEYTKVHYTLLQNKSKGKSTLVPQVWGMGCQWFIICQWIHCDIQ